MRLMMSLPIDGRNARNAIHAQRVIDLLIAPSSEHAACYLAVKLGLANTKEGNVSAVKLATATKLPRARVREILSGWRSAIEQSGGV